MATASSNFRVRLPRISTAAAGCSSSIWTPPPALSEEKRALRDLRQLASRIPAPEGRETREFPGKRGRGEHTRRLNPSHTVRPLLVGGGDVAGGRRLVRGCLQRHGGSAAPTGRRRRRLQPRPGSEAFKTTPEPGLPARPAPENGETDGAGGFFSAPEISRRNPRLWESLLRLRGDVATPGPFSTALAERVLLLQSLILLGFAVGTEVAYGAGDVYHFGKGENSVRRKVATYAVRVFLPFLYFSKAKHGYRKFRCQSYRLCDVYRRR